MLRRGQHWETEMRAPRLIAICLFAFCAGCAQVAAPPSAPERPAGEPSAEAERLLAEPPEGWMQVAQHNTEEMQIADFAPPGETIEDWTTLVSFESFASEEEVSPIELLITEADTDTERCTFLNHFSLAAGLENGYPTSVRMIFCGENEESGLGQAKIVKAISSQTRVYVVRITRRMDPFEAGETEGLSREEVAGWSTWLRRIKLCNPTSTKHPCPG